MWAYIKTSYNYSLFLFHNSTGESYINSFDLNVTDFALIYIFRTFCNHVYIYVLLFNYFFQL